MSDETAPACINCQRTKDEFVDENPMELVGMVMPVAPGMREAMSGAFVEEYVRLGWDEERLLVLFHNPAILGTHRVHRLRGEVSVRELIRTTLVDSVPAMPVKPASVA